MDRPSRHSLKGRGAVSNTSSRFESVPVEAFDDGWGGLDVEEEPVQTVVSFEATKSIFATNRSPDIPFSRSINPYRGCEHGCVYCYARPSHAYYGFSPGLDFETRIVAKRDGAQALERALRRPGYVPEPIALGANTDPYQPVEREHRVTRAILEVLHDFKHPVTLVTKGAMVLRDLDLLVPMAADGLVQVLVSVTTLERSLARTLEPRAAAPARRIEVIRALHEAGVPVGVLVAPMIPAVNDHELEAILSAAAGAGAAVAGTVMLRLPLEVAELFSEWLETHMPDRKDHVLSRIRDLRGGALNQSAFGRRMTGSGPYADLMRQRFDAACRRLGLSVDGPVLETRHFACPAQAGDQLDLF
jgi:DNA repair photolyase